MLAGGLDLIDRLKTGKSIDRIIHLAGVRELAEIRHGGNTRVSIGALTTHAALAHSEVLADVVPDLPAIWRTIANPRVRHVGTLGGNLMSAMPHYDALPALLALGGQALVFDREAKLEILALQALRGRNDLLLGEVRIGVTGVSRRLLADRSLHPLVSVYLAANIDDGKVDVARAARSRLFLRTGRRGRVAP